MKKTYLWTAIVTPLLPGGKIDLSSFENLLRKQENANNGVVILGSTGEALNLTLEEKKQIVEKTISLKLSVPILIGVGGHGLNETLDWLSWCENKNHDGYLMVTPHYAKPGIIGQTVWFETLMNHVSKPCMLYNVPGRSGVALYPEVLKKLASHPRFWALKEASGSTEKFAEFREAIPDHAIFSGDDGMLPFFTTIGCEGLVSVASNVWPSETNLYVQKCLAHQTESLFPLWDKATKALFLASNPVPVKVLLHHKGWIESPELKMPLHHEDFHHLEKLYRYDLKIQQWAKG